MYRKVSTEIHVLRNGGFLGMLRGLLDNPPTIKMQDSGAIKTVFQGTFEPMVVCRDKKLIELDPFSDELQPVLTIDGVSQPLGIFVPVSVSPSYEGGSAKERLSIEAYDRGWYVQTTTGKERVYFSRGTRYLEAIEQLLAASGIAVVNKTECADTFLEDREDWELGTDYLTIVNDLLKEINYKELWFDVSGAAILEPLSTPSVRNIQHYLDSRDPMTLVRPGLSRKTDFFKTPNVFICTCDNPEKSASLMAIARNTNDHSPLSIQRRGREIVQLTKVNNISSQNALQKYADHLLYESLMTGETLDVTTSLLLGWGIGDVVSLHYNDVHVLCVSRSWSMQLKAGGAMSHTLEKIVYNLDDYEETEGA